MGIDFQAIRASASLPDTVARYVELTARGTELVGLCPFHEERTPSFKIFNGRDGALFHCFACGEHGDVLDFVAAIEKESIAEAAARLTAGRLPHAGASPAPRAAPASTPGEWTVIAPIPRGTPPYNAAQTWNHKSGRFVDYSRAERIDTYRDTSGKILFHCVRLIVDGKKITPIVSRARHEDGREEWTTVRPAAPYPFMGLPALADKPYATVFIFEGEKKRALAETALEANACLSVLGGTAGGGRMDLTPLRGRHVVLWPDADEPGRAMVAGMGVALAGIAASVAYVDTSGMEKGADVADLIESGVDVAGWLSGRVTDDAPESAITKTAQPDPTASRPAKTFTARVSAVPSAAPATAPPPKSNVVPMPRRPPQPEPEIDIPPEYSDDQLALDFAAKFSTEFCFVADAGLSWYYWDGSRWDQDTTLLARDTIRSKICRPASAAARNRIDLGAKGDRIAGSLSAAKTVGNIDILSRADRRMAKSINSFDRDMWLLNTPGGIVDLRTGAMRPPSPEDYCRKMTAAAPGGDCPEWLSFIEQVTVGDAELAGFLKRWAGYCLTGSVKEEKFVFFYGQGGGGKGTFLTTLERALGDYAITTPMSTFTKRDRGNEVPADLADLNSSRMVIAQENEEGKKWNEERLKMCTGSDTIKARFMRQNFFQFVPTFKLSFAGNFKPQLDNVERGMRRRFLLVPFTNVLPIAQQDIELKDRLRAEFPGILQWALEGCLEWQRDGLGLPPVIAEATEEYFAEQDLTAQFIAQCIEQVPGNRLSVGALYDRYVVWCEAVGEDRKERRRFCEAMDTHGLRRVKTSLTVGGVRKTGVDAFNGIDLIVDWKNPPAGDAWS